MLPNGRRSKIRAPKKNLAGEVDFDQSWEVLSKAIREIQQKNASKLSFEELYRKSYNLVLRKYGKQLYESVKKLVAEHLDGIRNELALKKINDDTGKIELLELISGKWQDHLLSMRMISDVLMYLDRVFSKENHLPLTYDAGINLFRDVVVKNDNNSIGNTLNSLLLEEITNNRNGLIINISLVKSIIDMFEQLIEDEANLEMGENYYLQHFEPYYIRRTHEYYEKLSNEIFESQNGTQYIKKVEEVITNEQNRCVLYLPPVTYPKLISIVDEVLITSKIDKVMAFAQDGLKSWVAHNKFDELSLLYRLLTRVDYFGGFKQQLREIILEEGDKLEKLQEQEAQQAAKASSTTEGGKKTKVQGSKKVTSQAISWIEKIIKLKDKFDMILKSLESDVGIQKTMENAFVEFLNKNIKISEYLSLFIDDSIKRSGDKTEEEVEDVLNKAITIFRFIRDKDLFEKYYKNHLAKRLLKSSNDIEKVLISKIKNEIGSTFTSKLEGMFRDINLSRDLSSKFNQKNFEINVLTRTFWPIQPQQNQEVLLPRQLELLQNSFNEFYLGVHSGRNLAWSYNFGSIDIRIKFSKKVHELNMSLYCGIIVLLFEENGSLTFEEIETLTKIPKPDLIRSLQSIAVAPRTRILIKKPMSKDIKPGDVFDFNYDFHSPMTKIKVLTVANKVETDVERSKTIEKNDEERKFELDAAIVRIMKSRKTLRHNELVVETVKQITRFKPSPQFIKRRIDALLEREYLQRDEDDRTTYQYLA